MQQGVKTAQFREEKSCWDALISQLRLEISRASKLRGDFRPE